MYMYMYICVYVYVYVYICVWGTTPAKPEYGGKILDAYFENRRAPAAVELPLDWARLAGAVLAPGGSAPGLDGEPYEVYHAGVRYVAALLGQAFPAASQFPGLLLSYGTGTVD